MLGICCNMLDMVTIDTSVVLLASTASSTEQKEYQSASKFDDLITHSYVAT